MFVGKRVDSEIDHASAQPTGGRLHVESDKPYLRGAHFRGTRQTGRPHSVRIVKSLHDMFTIAPISSSRQRVHEYQTLQPSVSPLLSKQTNKQTNKQTTGLLTKWPRASLARTPSRHDYQSKSTTTSIVKFLPHPHLRLLPLLLAAFWF